MTSIQNGLSQISINNELITYNFSNLDLGKKDALISSLNFSQRYAIYKIFNEGIASQIDLEVQDFLISKIKEANQICLPATLQNEKISWISTAIKFFHTCISELAFYFCILTAEKTSRLINQILMKKLSENHLSSSEPLINQYQFRELIDLNKQRLESGSISLGELLEENGYKKVIYNLHLDENTSLKNMSIHNVDFLNCHFESCHFTGSLLTDSSFKFCNFHLSSFMNARIENVSFTDSNLRSPMFANSRLSNTHFIRSTLIASSFENAQIELSVFFNVTMPNTHFLQSNITDCKIMESDLRDCIFFECFQDFSCDTESFNTKMITKPTAAFLVHPEARGITTPKVYMKLEQNANIIPIRICFNVPSCDKDLINRQVTAILDNLKKQEADPIASNAQNLIRTLKDDPTLGDEVYKILIKTQIIAKHVNSIFLPGGEDVPPALYGKKSEIGSCWGNDYRRSLLELGLIHESNNKGIPLMAVCRGFQITYVYFGGKLKQHIDGHDGFQQLELLEGKSPSFFRPSVSKSFTVTSSHHQGIEFNKIDRASCDLEPIIVYDNIVKSAEYKFGTAVPMILLQFHPEWFNAPTAKDILGEIVDCTTTLMIDEFNDSFWQVFNECANKHRLHKEVLPQILNQLQTEINPFSLEETA